MPNHKIKIKNMSRKEKSDAIERWVVLITCVFKAEESIRKQWKDMLEEAKTATLERREQIAHDYFTAIAEEILSKN
jgi:hypothetical protein